MRKSITIILVVSALLTAGVFLAGCTEESGTAPSSTAAAAPVQEQGSVNAPSAGETPPSGTPPADMQMNGTRPSGTPPAGMEMNKTRPSGTPPADMQGDGMRPSGTPPSGTPPSGAPLADGQAAQ